jgi:heat shock protein HslJ
MRSVIAYRFGCVRNCLVALAVCVLSGIVAADAAERGFPYNSELMMDAKPMRGAKRVPMLVIGAKGEAKIEGWCNNVEAQMVVAGDTLTILTGASTEQQCPAERMRADQDLMAVLMEITHWRREGDLLTLRGTKTLRFRTLTN